MIRRMIMSRMNLAAEILFTKKTLRDDGNSNVQFVCQITIHEGYDTVEAGLIWTGKNRTNVPVLYNTDGTINEGAKKITVNKTNIYGQASVTINGIPSGKTVRGVAFAKMRNKNTGEEIWIFSEEIAVTVSLTVLS